MTIDEGLAALIAARDEIGGDAEMRLTSQHDCCEREILAGVVKHPIDFERKRFGLASVFCLVDGPEADPIEPPDFVVNAQELLATA